MESIREMWWNVFFFKVMSKEERKRGRRKDFLAEHILFFLKLGRKKKQEKAEKA